MGIVRVQLPDHFKIFQVGGSQYHHERSCSAVAHSNQVAIEKFDVTVRTEDAKR